MKKLELYSDFTLENKLTESEEYGFILDLGEGEVGETKQFEYFLYNPDGKVHKLDLLFEIDHPEVKILTAPTNLEPGQKEKIVLEWSPTLDLEDSLHTVIKISGMNKWKKPSLV